MEHKLKHGCCTQKVKNLLSELEKLTPGTQDYDIKIQQVMENLRPHNESEEQQDLPQLESKIDQQGSQAAARSFQLTKKFVPTR
jgi:hemerythrin superfamily protein